MRALRTPDERFRDLPGFDFEPHYVEIPNEGDPPLRFHFVDEGPRDGEVVLLLHGEPSWSYLYRHVIRVLTGAGLRAVAPDLLGFGRSDKPASREDYTFQRHVDWTLAFMDAAALSRVTLFCQDWGGLIGLRLAAEHPHRFERVAAGNTFLPTGDQAPPEAFFAWRQFSQTVPELPVGFIVKSGCAREVSPEVMAAYDAPFPDETFKAGARAFPALVPATPDDPASEPNRRAWRSLETFSRPFVTLFGDSDPITRGADRVLQARIPGAKGQSHANLARTGHFLQEDDGETLGRHLVDFVKKNPRS